MFGLSQSADYAIRALSCIESPRCSDKSSGGVAACSGIPRFYLGKISRRLVTAGFLVSRRGKRGVWPLAEGREKPMEGKIAFTQTLRPGVVSFALGLGHWATGAQDMVIDGVTIHGEPRRQKGVHANAAMWTDPHVKNTCLFDAVGGSVSFYDTFINLVPASETV